jgi:hypothetical protein
VVFSVFSVRLLVLNLHFFLFSCFFAFGKCLFALVANGQCFAEGAKSQITLHFAVCLVLNAALHGGRLINFADTGGKRERSEQKNQF